MTTRKEKQYKVKNAIIMAAGLSSRLAPLSYETPKALLTVKGEILIERQIIQLHEAGIDDITVVVGYKKEMFSYLANKFQVKIVENPDYKVRNNNSTLYCIRNLLSNTYICSADNYFVDNVFESYVSSSYYSAVFEEGETSEWCITSDDDGLITDVIIGGENEWVMLGHVFFSEEFSKKFINILEKIYHKPETKPLLWESIYIKYIKELPMYIRKYPKNVIFEFDTLEELRDFDEKYYDHSNSKILTDICKQLDCEERDIIHIEPLSNSTETIGFSFSVYDKSYLYYYETLHLTED